MILTPHKREQIMPLPVVLISTVGKDGVNNIAPWSSEEEVRRQFSVLRHYELARAEKRGNDIYLVPWG